jgi:DNA polymerase-3 subunit epsilon
MLIAGIDFETSGLDPTKDVIIEVGAVLWDTDLQAPLLIQSLLVDWNLDYIDPEATKVHGITVEQIKKYGVPPKTAWNIMNGIMEASKAVCAHNGNQFDKGFYAATAQRLETVGVDKLWIDTMTDIEFPEHIKTRKLTHLAAEHNFLNPFAHRAVFDVLTMLRMLSFYDIKQVVASAKEPMVYLKAMVDFSERKQASDRGYRWHADSKTWWKGMKSSAAAKERKEAPFRCMEINNPEAKKLI